MTGGAAGSGDPYKAAPPNQTAVEDYDAVGESRWPMALAVFGMVALTLIPPALFTFVSVPIFPIIVAVLMGILVVGDPGRIDRRAPWLRYVSILLAGVMVFAATLGTVVLVVGLVSGAPEVRQAGPLLIYGAKVWLGNNVAFAILFWNMDSGGPAERVHGSGRYPDFLFPQTADRSLAPPSWRPRFIDYLYIAFTNANAFSPTDSLPLTGRAKLAMQVQALISYTLLTLVLARVVSAFV